MTYRCGDTTCESTGIALRERWRVATLAAGWATPDYWEVWPLDAVCGALANGQGLLDALYDLGSARGEQGIGLHQTMLDVAALYSTAFAEPDPADVSQLQTTWAQAVARGWWATATGRLGDATALEAFAGLCTAAYFRTRLAEIYEAGPVEGLIPPQGHTLVLVDVNLRPDWPFDSTLAMIFVSDVLRRMLPNGESRALLAPSTAVVLTRTRPRLNKRIAAARRLIVERLVLNLSVGLDWRVRVWREPLPARYRDACDLISSMGCC